MEKLTVEQILARRKTLKSVKGPTPSIKDNVLRILAKQSETTKVTMGERLETTDIQGAIDALTAQLQSNQKENLEYMQAVAAKAQTDADAAKAAATPAPVVPVAAPTPAAVVA